MSLDGWITRAPGIEDAPDYEGEESEPACLVCGDVGCECDAELCDGCDECAGPRYREPSDEGYEDADVYGDAGLEVEDYR
jgi:hypothetical protein